MERTNGGEHRARDEGEVSIMTTSTKQATKPATPRTLEVVLAELAEECGRAAELIRQRTSAPCQPGRGSAAC